MSSIRKQLGGGRLGANRTGLPESQIRNNAQRFSSSSENAQPTSVIVKPVISSIVIDEDDESTTAFESATESAMEFNSTLPTGWNTNEDVSCLLKECGFVICVEHSGYLTVEPRTFRLSLSKKLKEDDHVSAEDIVAYLEKYIGTDKTGLIWLLMPTATYSRGTLDTTYQQPSALRLLLSVPELQIAVADILLALLAEVGGEATTREARSFDFVAAIMSQFKWLEYLVDPSSLLRSFQATITMAGKMSRVKEEIISAIPEVFDDALHEQVVTHFRQYLEKEASDPESIYGAVLGALSKLNVEPLVMDELRDFVIEGLDDIATNFIPLALQFVHSTLTKSNALQTLSFLHRKLVHHFDEDDYVIQRTQPEARQKYIIQTFCELKSSLLMQKFIQSAWLSIYSTQISAALDDEPPIEAEMLKPFDFVLLTVMHSVAFRKKPIEDCLKSKARHHLISAATLKLAFDNYSYILAEHVKSLLAFADSVVDSTDSSLSTIGRQIHITSFVKFDVIVKQDIVANLVTHVFLLNSSHSGAMNVLLALSEEHPELLGRFRAFIRNMLDVLDNLCLSDMRKLCRILANLAFARGEHNAVPLHVEERRRFKDDMHLIVRKHLAMAAHNAGVDKRKQFGVVAAAMLVRGLGIAAKNHDEISMSVDFTAESSSLSSGLSGQKSSSEIVDIFWLVERNLSSSGHYANASSVMSIFYDELSVIIRTDCLPEDVVTWISQTACEWLDKDFMTSIDAVADPSTLSQSSQPQRGLIFSSSLPIENVLTIAKEPNITLKLMMNALLAYTSKRDGGLAILPTLTPLLRLVVTACRKQHGNTDIIGGLLDAPVGFVSLERLSNLGFLRSLSPLEQRAVCEAIFQLINWFRELLNSFGLNEADETRSSCLKRIQHAVQLYDLFDKVVGAVCPSWWPLGSPPPLSLAGNVGKKGKRPASAGTQNRAAKKSKKDGVAATLTSQLAKSQKTQKSQAKTQKAGNGPSKTAAADIIASRRLRNYFRELTLDALSLIGGDFSHKYSNHSVVSNPESSVLRMSTSTATSQPRTVSVANTTGTGANSTFSSIFGPREVLLLVDDLAEKLRIKLQSSHVIPIGTAQLYTMAQLKPVVALTGSTQRELDEVSLEQLLVKCVQLIPAMCGHLEGCYSMIRLCSPADETDFGDDSTNDLSLQRRECEAGIRLYNQIFIIFSILLHYSRRIGHDIGQKIVSSFRTFAASMNQSVPELCRTQMSTTSKKNSVEDAFTWLGSFQEVMPTLDCAAAYVCTLSTLLEYVTNEKEKLKLQENLSEICRSLLKSEWKESPVRYASAIPVADDAARQKAVAFLFRMLLQSSPKKIDEIFHFVTKIVPELVGKGESDSGSSSDDDDVCTYPLLTRKSFPAFFEVIFIELVQLVLAAPTLDSPMNLTQQQANNDEDEMSPLDRRRRSNLKAWFFVVEAFQATSQIIRDFEESSRCLTIFLKHGRAFVEAFAKRAMPVLGDAWSSMSDKVQELLSRFQIGTRLMQNVTVHSKDIRDASLMAQVPRTKKTLETFIFLVKQLLTTHDCLGAFVCGTLRNKTIKGDVLPSQKDARASADEDDGQEDEDDTTTAVSNSVGGSGENEDERDNEDDEEEEEEGTNVSDDDAETREEDEEEEQEEDGDEENIAETDDGDEDQDESSSGAVEISDDPYDQGDYDDRNRRRSSVSTAYNTSYFR